MTGTYTYAQVRDASIEYFGGDELSAEVFAAKYALQDGEGSLFELTPADMHERLAKEFFRIESAYPNPLPFEDIKDLLSTWKFVPQGSPMSGVGNDMTMQSLSNCFCIAPPEDSYGGIMRADQEQVQIMKRRGGVGFDVSSLRPKGMLTTNAAKTTDGVGVFVQRFSNSAREVAQNGRRGALLLCMSVAHPEIETFINIKRDKTKVTGANLSVKITDEFMEAVERNVDYVLRWPCDCAPERAKFTKTVNARALWDNIVSAAHDNAEPGLLFWDNVQKYTPSDCYSDVKSTAVNPCAELILSAYGSCILSLMNLTRYVRGAFTADACFDIDTFFSDTVKAQRLIDDLVDLEIEKIDRIILKIDQDPEDYEVKRVESELWDNIRNTLLATRRTGLGVTGLGDAVAMCGIRYGSDECASFVENVLQTFNRAAYTSSVRLAKERKAFALYDAHAEVDNPYVQRVFSNLSDEAQADWKQFGRRNIALLTVSPAGSVSTLTQTTSGFEPAYMLSYTRRRKLSESDRMSRVDRTDASGDRWQEYTVHHHGLQQWAKVTGNNVADVDKSPYHMSTSRDIDWQASVKLQAIAQRWICHAISRTVNLPSSVSKDVIGEIYMRAWKEGCKGITVYRDGSRDGVLVDKQTQVPDEPRRPQRLPCEVHKVQVKGEQYVLLVGLMNGKPYEIFAGTSQFIDVPKKIKHGFLVKNGKKDGVSTYNLSISVEDAELVFKDIVNLFDNSVHGAFTRTLSLALRHGVPLTGVIEQLRKDKHSDITSFASAVARVLKSYVSDGTVSSERCPECGKKSMVYQEGCMRCSCCGWSKC